MNKQYSTTLDHLIYSCVELLGIKLGLFRIEKKMHMYLYIIYCQTPMKVILLLS